MGLNESGKTTVLEAISYFETKDPHFESLYYEDFPRGDVNDLVPLKKKANFNDDIVITATITLSEADRKEIAQYAQQSLFFKMDPNEIKEEISINRTLNFENSIYKTTQVLWSPSFIGIPRGRKIKKSLISHNKDNWLKLVNHIRERIPAILYFPTFLFEIPSRIYLQPDEEETPTNAYYRDIVQDILDCLNDDLLVQKHIVDRALNGGNVNRRNLDSVLTKMGNVVTKTIFESWNEIFARKVPRKDIVITCDLDNPTQGNNSKQRVLSGIYDQGRRQSLSYH